MKATPIPDSIERRPGGIDCATCGICGGHITKVSRDPDREVAYPWWHVATGRTTCGEKS